MDWLVRAISQALAVAAAPAGEHLKVRDGAQGCQLLDRLVDQAVLAQTDVGMGPSYGRPAPSSVRPAGSRAGIVGECQECPAIGDEPAMQRGPVHHRRHAMFANTAMDIAARIVVRAYSRHSLAAGQFRPVQIRASANGPGQGRVDDLQRHFAGLAGCDLRAIRNAPLVMIGDQILLGG